MEYLSAVLGTYFVVHTMKMFVDASEQIWTPIETGVAIGAACLFFGPSSWYLGLPVAGVVVFLQHFENLLIVKGDELVNKVLRRR